MGAILFFGGEWCHMVYYLRLYYTGLYLGYLLSLSPLGSIVTLLHQYYSTGSIFEAFIITHLVWLYQVYKAYTTPSAPVSRAQSPAPMLHTRTRSLSLSDSHTVPPANNFTTTPGNKRRLFQFIKKTGASIRSRVVRVKDLALCHRYGKTRACRSRNCMCCIMISDRQSFRYNDMNVKAGGGSCASYNIVYLVVCSICWKHYVGRSARCLRTRIGEHRRYYYQIVDNKPFHVDNDDYALGAHLYNHGYSDKSDFSKYFKVCVLEVCSPKVLEVKEHMYIHKLNSLCPNGVNISNPFSIPVLNRF